MYKVSFERLISPILIFHLQKTISYFGDQIIYISGLSFNPDFVSIPGSIKNICMYTNANPMKVSSLRTSSLGMSGNHKTIHQQHRSVLQHGNHYFFHFIVL